MTTKSLLFLLLIFILPFVSAQKNNQERIVFTIQINSNLKASEFRVFLNWKDLSARIGKIEKQKIQIFDLKDNKEIFYTFIADKKTEGVCFTIGYDKNESLKNSNESIRTFELKYNPDLKIKVATDSIIPSSEKITITFLTEAKDFIASHGIKSWSETTANTILDTYPNPADMEIFSRGKWSYTNGYFLNALSDCYLLNKNSKYSDYIKQWVDLFVNANGIIADSKYRFDDFELDNIAPGRLLLFLYQQTGDSRYAKAADQLIDQLNHQPRTSDGGFWHKKVYTNQMWLDGIYMADVYLAQYASIFNKPQYFDEAAKQMEIIYKHTYDQRTGLLFHGWDESKNKIWADSLTGASPEIWGRALGWYFMALVDGLDYFPDNHPERQKLLQIFKNLASNLVKYQDTTSGLWYQIVNKGTSPGNWFETSCSAMFAYALAKGVQRGYLGKGYLQKAKKAFNGLIDNEVFFDDQGKIYINGTVKVGTLSFRASRGDYDYYIGVDRRINDFKGVAAFLYLSLILNK